MEDERQDGGQPIGELLDALSPANRRTLAAAGFGMDRLRELAATESGARQVRHIVTEFGAEPGRRAALRRLARPEPGAAAPARHVAAFWVSYVLAVAVGMLLAGAATVLAGAVVGALTGAVVVLACFFVGPGLLPQSPWGALALLATLPAAILLAAMIVLWAPQGYLSAYGKQVAATVEAPTYTWQHGARVATCRVRLPDGSVHGLRADGSCASQAGQTRTVTYDPHGRVGPRFGTRAGLGATDRKVAEGAAAVIVAAAITAVAASGRRKGTR